MIGRTAIQPEAGMKIELLKSCHSPGAAAVEDLAGPRMVGIVADVLDKQVAGRPQVTLERQGRFEGRIDCVLAREPCDSEHTVERPVVTDPARPRELDVRIGAVAGNFAGAGRESQTAGCR